MAIYETFGLETLRDNIDNVLGDTSFDLGVVRDAFDKRELARARKSLYEAIPQLP